MIRYDFQFISLQVIHDAGSNGDDANLEEMTVKKQEIGASYNFPCRGTNILKSEFTLKFYKKKS